MYMERRPQSLYAGRRETADHSQGGVIVTTIDAAAAWRRKQSVAFAVLTGFIGFGVAGCETGANLFAGNADPNASIVAGQPTATTSNSQTAQISIAPVIGAPDAVAKQLQTQLTSDIEAQRISVAKSPNETSQYTLRGYVVSARERGRTKVSYIWDVTDSAGQRVNRITGEEVISGARSSDPWAAVSPQVVGTISKKTVGSLSTWLPTQQTSAPTAMSGTPSGSASTSSVTPSLQTAASSVAQSPTGRPAPTPTTTAAAAPTATQTAATTTGSIQRGKVNAMVPSVAGAPGDGSVSLTSAIQRELTRNGVALTNSASGQTYRVEGRVAVGQAQNGKQPIQIDWNVKDPKGKSLGTVSQKNEIPQGSLDGAWGKTADAAASAAAQGILKLLPGQGQTQVN